MQIFISSRYDCIINVSVESPNQNMKKTLKKTKNSYCQNRLLKKINKKHGTLITETDCEKK